MKKKDGLVNEKILLEKKLREYRSKSQAWLEPMREFILTSKNVKTVANSRDLSEIRHFMKNIGSNFLLKGKTLLFEPYFGWDIAAEAATFPNWYPQ